MHFDLVDRVLEQSADRIVTLKQVSAAEEYLQDHFASFPVLPGVLMLEAMVQAARRLAEANGDRGPVVLGRVRALKYGRFVRPGEALRVEVTVRPESGAPGQYDCRAEAFVVTPGVDERPMAASGRFTLRPVCRAERPVPGYHPALGAG